MSKLAYPKGRLLLVRDCTVDICLKNNPGAVLLSVLLFWYDNPHKGDWENPDLHEFCMCRTQAEIEEASCHQIDVKTIHDTAIPLLCLLGYLHVGKKMNGDLYVLHMDRVIAAFAAYEQSLKQHDPDILKNHIRSLLQLESALIEMTEDELESALINKSRLYILLARALIRIREGSNCKRGRKPRPQAAQEANSENTEIYRDSIEISTKRNKGDAFASHAFLPEEDVFSEEDEPPPTVHRMPAIKLNGANQNGHHRPADLHPDNTPDVDSVRSPEHESRQGNVQQTPLPVQAAPVTPPNSEPRASGERGTPEKPTQQASSTQVEGKETAKQHKARIDKRKSEIIALYCELLGRKKIVLSKDNLDGAKLLAEAESSDAEITQTYNRYKNDKFWGPQLTLKIIAKLLDTTVTSDKPAAPPGQEENPYTITALLKRQAQQQLEGV